MSHSRFYWGETRNDLTRPLFKPPIPASRNLALTGYVLAVGPERLEPLSPLSSRLGSGIYRIAVLNLRPPYRQKLPNNIR
jgi:hypothetical protein